MRILKTRGNRKKSRRRSHYRNRPLARRRKGAALMAGVESTLMRQKACAAFVAFYGGSFIGRLKTFTSSRAAVPGGVYVPEPDSVRSDRYLWISDRLPFRSSPAA